MKKSSNPFAKTAKEKMTDKMGGKKADMKKSMMKKKK
jgi:hypothetical protein